MANILTLTAGTAALTFGFTKRFIQETNKRINEFDKDSVIGKVAHRSAKENVQAGEELALEAYEKIDAATEYSMDKIGSAKDYIVELYEDCCAKTAKDELDEYSIKSNEYRAYIAKLRNLKHSDEKILELFNKRFKIK